VSFVEKALNRMKRREQEMAPLGEYRDTEERSARGYTRDAAPERPEASDHHTAGAEPDSPRAGSLTVAVDRDRLREEGFIAPEKYHRQLADEYRRIKRPLIANAFGIGVPQVEGGNLILVTSAVAGEGKTHTCINLALSLATERDQTVLLVDGDVPKPHISRLFGIQDQPGLLDALGDKQLRLDELLIRTDIPRLSILPAGKWSDHATEMLASGRMRELAEELSTRYPDRIILIDSPPLLAATEAQAIGAVAGQVVLVIAEGLTPQESVRSALGLLDERKPVNAILNKSRRSSAGGYYYGGYGAYGDARREAPDAA
jgi:protein-tyrosine kinase